MIALYGAGALLLYYLVIRIWSTRKRKRDNIRRLENNLIYLALVEYTLEKRVYTMFKVFRDLEILD